MLSQFGYNRAEYTAVWSGLHLQGRRRSQYFDRITPRYNPGDSCVRSSRCETLKFSKYVTT
jgi:hypothetical protein